MKEANGHDDESDFDFEEWASSKSGATFENCAKAAIRSLAVSDKDLRTRLRGALFCLFYCEGKRIPSVCQVEYDEISKYVRDRLGDDVNFSSLRQFTRKLKMKSAKRLAGRIVGICERLM